MTSLPPDPRYLLRYPPFSVKWVISLPLLDAVQRLKNLSEVGIVHFEIEDIVRNLIISHILDRYDD
jgi:phosphate starvation-inducible protein PhoH